MSKLSDSNNFSQVPSILSANKEILFGNIKEIYNFHNKLVFVYFDYFYSQSLNCYFH